MTSFLLRGNGVPCVYLLIGISLVLLGFLFTRSPSKESLSTITISVGCSLIATAISDMMTLRQIRKDLTAREIIEKTGLINIYPTRSEMNLKSNEALRKMKKSLDVVAWGLKSLRDAQTELLEEKLRVEGVKIR